MEKCLSSDDTTGITLQEEASLINAARSDPAVFNQLYLAYVRPVYHYIFSKVGEARQAEDVTAQVFLAALESLPRYRHDGHFAAWLFGIARHKLADNFRLQRTELPIDITDRIPNKKDDPLSELIQNEETNRIWEAIHELEERDQELLRLRFVAGLNFGEIAQLIHSNMEATKKRFYRLLTHLRQQVEIGHE